MCCLDNIQLSQTKTNVAIATTKTKEHTLMTVTDWHCVGSKYSANLNLNFNFNLKVNKRVKKEIYYYIAFLIKEIVYTIATNLYFINVQKLQDTKRT